jgi:MFS family permease
VHYRLSLLMFFVYAVPGAWIPLLSLRLEEELHFTPMQTACAFSSWAIGCFAASLVAGQIADRWLALERCIAVGSAVAGVLLFAQAEATSPFWVCVFAVGQCLLIAPIVSLAAALCLTHLQAPERQFGRVRLWGTVGWLLPGLLLGLWLRQPDCCELLLRCLGRDHCSVADSQRLAGLLAFALGGYALTLPHTPPLQQTRSWLAPLAAFRLFRERPFAVFCLSSFLLNVSIPFQTQLAALQLRSLGLVREWVGPVLTIAQWSEVLTLWLLPVISLRLGMRATLVSGLAAWAVGLALLAAGSPLWLVAASLLMNGLMIGCFWVRGQVFISRQAGPEIRSSAQGLAAMLNGAALLLGHLLVGQVRGVVGTDFTTSFGVGTAIAVSAVVLFLVGFRPAAEPAAADADVRWLLQSGNVPDVELVEQQAA